MDEAWNCQFAPKTKEESKKSTETGELVPKNAICWQGYENWENI